jgi:uncharacterized membrane protein YjfL (UPF0719 family)
MAELLNNEYFVWGAMAIIVLCLSQILKLPIKALTKKTIKDQNIRNRVNTVIMIVPILLGILCDFLFCTLYLHIPFDIVEGIKVGGTAITLYGVLEKLIKGAQSKETTATLELVENITKDGKVDKEDNSTIKDFVDKLNKVQ